MVSYFYSSINYTAYHTGNTVPYQRAFLRSSASTVSGGKSLCVPRLTRFDRPRKMRDFEIFICHFVAHRTSMMQHAHTVVIIPSLLSNCHAHATTRMSFFLLFTLFTSSGSSTDAASLKVSTNRHKLFHCSGIGVMHHNNSERGVLPITHDEFYLFLTHSLALILYWPESLLQGTVS